METGGRGFWSTEQKTQWQLRWNTYLADTARVAHNAEIDQRRKIIQTDLRQILQAFLDGTLMVKDFNVLFQQKAHEEHNAFHLRGMSGGMFFHKLVKHIPDDQQLSRHLRTILVVPTEVREGQRHMRSFMQFLETLIAQHISSREQLQPARLPFFLSAWWHIQNPLHWPIFYPLVHTVLLSETQRGPSPQGSIQEYFLFRTQFLALAKALELSPWELEHLLTWYGQDAFLEGNRKYLQKRSSRPLSRKEKQREDELPCTPTFPPASLPDALLLQDVQQYERERHTHLQWLLAKIGQKIGCSVWIAINDHQKVWQQERLGDLSISCLPQFTDSAFHQIIRRIDVLWLHQDTVVAAYEIEHTTDIATGLLRLYDLGALCTQINHLCIVAPQERFRRIQFELSRPSFQRNEMQKKCGLIAEELLLKHEEHILRWAGSLSVIEQLLSPLPSSLLLSS